MSKARRRSTMVPAPSPYLAAARADFLTRLGRFDDARVAFEEALILTENDAERRYLQTRLREQTG